MSGIRTPNIQQSSLIDSVIANRGGSTRRQPVTDLAYQLAQTAPLNLAGSQAPLFATEAAMRAAVIATKVSSWVYNDPNPEKNGIWSWQDEDWIWTLPLPYSVATLDNDNAGTPNAIIATSRVPLTDGMIVILPITATNTAFPVTLAVNDEAVRTIKTVSGNDVVVGGLIAGMDIVMFVKGTTVRLSGDQASAAIVAQAEEAAAAAVAAVAALQKGLPNGVAELDADGEVPDGQIPDRLKAQGHVITNANTATEAGYYFVAAGGTNVPDNTVGWQVNVVSRYNGNTAVSYIRQVASQVKSDGTLTTVQCERVGYIVSGVFTWSVWMRVYKTRSELYEFIRDTSECLLSSFAEDLALSDTDDWRPAFNAAVNKVASVTPVTGATIRLPPKQVRLSYCDRITADGILFRGQGKKQLQNADEGDIRALDVAQPMFGWGTTATEATGGGLQEISIEASRRTSTATYLFDLISPKGTNFKDLWIRQPYHFAQIQGGIDPTFENVHVGGYRGRGMRFVGTDTLRGDRAHLINVLVGGYSTDGVSASNTGPALSVEGYWHSLYGQKVEVITVNQGLLIDSAYTDNAYMPQFVIIDQFVCDYVDNYAVYFNKGEHVRLIEPYINGSQNSDLIYHGAAAAGMKIIGGKVGYSRYRVATVRGIGFLMKGCDIHRWDQALGGEAAFYLHATANSVALLGNEVGRTGKLGGGGSDAGKRLVAVEAGANAYRSNMNEVIGLASTYQEGTPVGTNLVRS